VPTKISAFVAMHGGEYTCGAQFCYGKHRDLPVRYVLSEITAPACLKPLCALTGRDAKLAFRQPGNARDFCSCPQ
jgi:hypothetical protein